MWKYSIENFALIFHEKFSKIVTFCTVKLYTYGQDWILREANEAIVSSPLLRVSHLAFGMRC